MKTVLVLMLFALGLPAQAAPGFNCSGIANFTDPATGETSYSELVMQLSALSATTFNVVVMENLEQVASGTLKLTTPAVFHAEGVGASDAKVTWDGLLDFQVQGPMIYGDLKFSKDTTETDGSVSAHLEGHTYQACKRGR